MVGGGKHGKGKKCHKCGRPVKGHPRPIGDNCTQYRPAPAHPPPGPGPPAPGPQDPGPEGPSGSPVIPEPNAGPEPPSGDEEEDGDTEPPNTEPDIVPINPGDNPP